MNRKASIQVFEYQKLRIDERTPGFNRHHFEALVRFNENNNNKYFTVIHNGIQFKSFVGVLQIDGLTIEILPKTDKAAHPSNESSWRSVLLNMLQVCKYLPIDYVSETYLNKRYNSILDIYFEQYLQEVETLIKRGLIKKYRKVERNQTALRGKLLLSQHIQKNIVHKERFFCQHQLYDRDHLLHQILLNGLEILDDLVGSNLRDRLKRILWEFNGFKHEAITEKHFNHIPFDRKTQPYKKALDIAKMIILNYSPSINTGNTNMLALLFDMNKLWEEYIFRIMDKHKPEGYYVSFQNSKVFWNHKRIKPDILVKTNKGESIVIDTKWKIINENDPSDEDLKQMFAYNITWGAEKSILLYPSVNQEENNFGRFSSNLIVKNGSEYTEKQTGCKLGFVSLLGNNGLLDPQQIAAGIFRKLT